MSNSPSSANKRTRTIIVARTINDEPSPGEHAAVIAGSSTHQWRNSNAKLPTYAALGSSEDVGLYEKFLAEQQRQPSATELRQGGGAASSPQHLTPSAKRKTVNQLVDGGSRSGSSSSVASVLAHNDNNSHTAAIDSAMQLENERDAKKKRDALVQHRKWLKALPIHERLAHARQQNALKHWQQINREWTQFKARAAKKLRKPAHALVMSRAAAYREQVEMYDALQKARPFAEKVGGDIWLASLRGDGTRFVPVGNIFSGLFCPIRESTKVGPRVRRPLDPSSGVDRSNDSSAGAVRPVSLLEKRSLEMLARKKRRLRKQLAVLLPHEVDASGSGRLVVETLDLFEWASRGHDYEENVTSVRGTSIDSDGDRESVACSDAMARALLCAASSRDGSAHGHEGEKTDSSFVGPSVRLSVENDGGSGYDEHPPLLQHHLDITALPSVYANEQPPVVQLRLFGATHEQLQQSIVLLNDGMTVLHYQWTREPFVDVELTPHLLHNRSRTSTQDDSDERQTTTSLSHPHGRLCPGDAQTFVFCFVSERPGVFLETWLLDIDPRARVQTPDAIVLRHHPLALRPFDAQPQHPATTATTLQTSSAVHVHLSCTAVDNFVPRRQRRDQRVAIERNAIVFLVEQLVTSIVDSIETPHCVVFPELHAIAAQFYDVNRDDGYSDVYYSDALIERCRGLYAQAVQVLMYNEQEKKATEEAAAHSSSESAAEEAAESDGAVAITLQRSARAAVAGDSSVVGDSSNTAVGATAPVHDYDNEWIDLRLASLSTLTQRADALNAAKSKQLSVELAAIAAAEEQDEEDDDEEEDESDEESDEGDGDEEDSDDSTTKAAGDAVATLPKAAKESRIERRLRVQRERQQQREALTQQLQTLRPRLQDAFRTVVLEANAAPYDSTTFATQLAYNLASLCSEVPLIHEIARLQAPCEAVEGSSSISRFVDSRSDGARAATTVGVAQLFTRAVDDAVAIDRTYQRTSEHAHRRFQHALWSDARTFDTLFAAEERLSSHDDPVAANSTDSATIEPAPPMPPTWLRTGVLLLHVDLDLAHWFKLVRVPGDSTDAAAAADAEAPATDRVTAAAAVLQWQFSPELLARGDVVPPQVVRTAQSLAKLLQRIASYRVPVQAIVLVSDLRAPPVTAAAHKLLQRALRSTETGGNTKALKEQRTHVLQRLISQLTLAPVVTILTRAMQRVYSVDESDATASIAFCASLHELQDKLCALEAVDASIAQSSCATGRPQLLLLEHVDELARVAAGGAARRVGSAQASSGASVVAAAPPMDFKPTPASASVAAARKKSVATTSSPTKAATATAATAPAPALSSAPTVAPSEPAFSLDEPPLSPTALRKSIHTLASKLTHVCDAFVLDTLLPTPWSRLFSNPQTLETTQLQPPPPPVVLGPALLATTAYWTTFVQPSSPALSPAPLNTVVTAIVGGKDLASKLRLLDALLDVADTIYVVGDVALSLCRVLVTQYEPTGALESAPTLWRILVPAIERLKQKAQRKCVQVLIPVDWVVGDTSLEEQDMTSGAADEEEEEEEEGDEESEEEEKEEDAEEEEAEAEDTQSTRRSSKAKTRAAKRARKQQQRAAAAIAATKCLKPVVEPDEVVSARTTQQWTYDGETAVVQHEKLRSATTWLSMNDVHVDFFALFSVVDGNTSVLESKGALREEEDSDDEEEEEKKNDSAFVTATSSNSDTSGLVGDAVADVSSQDAAPSSPSSPRGLVLDNATAFAHEWTSRAFDVGPASMQRLLDALRRAESAPQYQRLIVHGLFGVVECQCFDRSTRAFVSFLESSVFQQQGSLTTQPPSMPFGDSATSEARKTLLLSGDATLRWFQRLETPGKQYTSKLVTTQQRKMASELRGVLAAKPSELLLRLQDVRSTTQSSAADGGSNVASV